MYLFTLSSFDFYLEDVKAIPKQNYFMIISYYRSYKLSKIFCLYVESRRKQRDYVKYSTQYNNYLFEKWIHPK